MKNKQKAIAQGRRCSGAVEVSQQKRWRLLTSQINGHAQG